MKDTVFFLPCLQKVVNAVGKLISSKTWDPAGDIETQKGENKLNVQVYIQELESTNQKQLL